MSKEQPWLMEDAYIKLEDGREGRVLAVSSNPENQYVSFNNKGAVDLFYPDETSYEILSGGPARLRLTFTVKELDAMLGRGDGSALRQKLKNLSQSYGEDTVLMIGPMPHFDPEILQDPGS